MSGSTLWFVRHGETALAGTFCGRSDPPLNAVGLVQARATAERLRTQRIATVYSSPRRRALETAAMFAPAGHEVTIRPALAEIYFGAWEGLTWKQIEALDPVYAQRWVREFPALPAPGGELFETFRSRVLAEILALRVAAETGSLVAVTHAGVLRVLGEEFGGWTAEQAWERTRTYGCVLRCTQSSARSQLSLEPDGAS